MDDFLSETELECISLIPTFTDLSYSRERGRLTIKFGEQYGYNVNQLVGLLYMAIMDQVVNLVFNCQLSEV